MSDLRLENVPALLSLAAGVRDSFQAEDGLNQKVETDVAAARERIESAVAPRRQALRVLRGRLLIQARALHETKASFALWIKNEFDGRSVSDAYACMKLAGADDTGEAAEAEKARARDGMRATRAARQSVTAPDVTDKPPTPERPITYVPEGGLTTRAVSKPVDLPEPVTALDALLSAWERAGETERDLFLEHIGAAFNALPERHDCLPAWMTGSVRAGKLN
jgi:hypothetical protein